MKFFSKKKDDEFFTLLDDTPPFTIEPQEKEEKNTPNPNVLTPEEILGVNTEVTAEMTDSMSALEALKQRIAAVAENTADKKEEAVNDLSEKPVPEKEVKEQEASKEIPVITPSAEPIREMLSALEPKAADTVKTKDTAEEKSGEKTKPLSLLDKCLPYILDDDGKEAVDSEPLYKLQSVADILKSDSEKTLERLSEKYDIAFDDLGYTDSKYSAPEPKAEPQKKEKAPEQKTVLPEKEVFEETLPIKNQVKNVQSNVVSVISDIDTPDIKLEEQHNEDISKTATITFTPVSDGESSGSHISVSTQTRPIDLTGELVRMPESTAESADEQIQLEKNEFEEYAPQEEINNEKDAMKLVRAFSIKKRRAFLQTVFSFLLTAVLAVAKLPFLSEVLLSHTTVSMIICAAVTGIIVIINCDMFLKLPKLFSKQGTPDALACVASVFTAAYAVFGILSANIIVDMLILLSVILSFRALSRFYKFSHMLSNLKVICQNGQKRAVRLISDTAVTFAMAKNAVEGDALIAAPQKTDRINDYMKYTTFGSALGGKIPLIAILSLILSVAVGFTCASYFDGAVHGFYAAASIQCFAALPVLFFIENLPLYRTAKKLNRKGAMIAGKTGAEHIEMANAAVLNACDLFPSGTVTLHQMQVLSENNLEDTIIRAASLTESLDSPLTSIFKKIAGTGNITVFPDSDTVKYEDRMGISGWVDNRLLFIGNRTLMEAHGIEVPPVEVDRKILTQGYFPVYVATRDKACALLVIQYSVDTTVAHELRRLTSLGVTLLVNSCDPNLTEEMICDYLGLYSDSVKVMSAAGCHMYKNTVTHAESISAPAAYKSNPIALASIINCASKIKRSNLLLTVIYAVCAVLGAVIFAYTSLGGSGNLISESTLLLYGLITTAVSYLIYLTERP